jgi:hypothetical protein
MVRIWLDVPYAEKDEAKAAGAWWDPDARRWYAPRPGLDRLTRWVAAPPVPELLPGEDRRLGSGLFVDLVPRSCWFSNARTCVDERDWERLRRMVLQRAGWRCEACDAAADRDRPRWLEVHERWTYDDATRVQALRRLVCLCNDCHATTHYGLATVRGRDDAALAHLRAVTGMTTTEARQHVAEAVDRYTRRSRHTWRLDLDLLTGAGVTLRRPGRAGVL